LKAREAEEGRNLPLDAKRESDEDKKRLRENGVRRKGIRVTGTHST